MREAFDSTVKTEMVLGRAAVPSQICVDTRVTCGECHHRVLNLWASCHTATTA